MTECLQMLTQTPFISGLKVLKFINLVSVDLKVLFFSFKQLLGFVKLKFKVVSKLILVFKLLLHVFELLVFRLEQRFKFLVFSL